MDAHTPAGLEPALATLTRSPAAVRRMPSAKWERQELPVQRMRMSGVAINSSLRSNPNPHFQTQGRRPLSPCSPYALSPGGTLIQSQKLGLPGSDIEKYRSSLRIPLPRPNHRLGTGHSPDRRPCRVFLGVSG